MAVEPCRAGSRRCRGGVPPHSRQPARIVSPTPLYQSLAPLPERLVVPSATERSSRLSRRAGIHRLCSGAQELAELPYPDQPIADPDDPKVSHVFRREGDRIWFETHTQDEVKKAVVEYAFGSRDHYASLVGADEQGAPHILRLSHYQSGRESGWARTTGHSADAAGGRDLLGKRLEPIDGTHRCLFCHSTNPTAVLSKSGPESNDRGIGCERCHGPGGLHLKAVAAKFRDRAIINPRGASAEGRLRICGQCHSYHQELTLPRTDSFWIRFQGTTLPWSRCYTESAGGLDCVTCHDPHKSAEPSPEAYTARCLSCHSASACSAGSDSRFGHGLDFQSTNGGLPDQPHAGMRRLSHAAVLERANPRHLHRSLHSRSPRAQGSEPQVDLVLLEIPHEQVRDSEEDRQSQHSVPERCRDVAGDDCAHGPLDKMMNDVGSQRVLTERSEDADLKRGDVAQHDEEGVDGQGEARREERKRQAHDLLVHRPVAMRANFDRWWLHERRCCQQ